MTIYYDSLVEVVPKILLALVICTIVYLFLKIVGNRVISFVTKRADDKLLVNFVKSIFNILIAVLVVLMFLFIIGQGAIATSILGAAGVSAFVIGFALKDIGENFLAGVIMAFDRPFRLGDTIKTGNVEGVITEMSLRDTHVKTFDGKDVYIPNGQIIKNPLFNYTIDGFIRQNFTIGIDQKADVEQARKLILDAVNRVEGILQEGKTTKTFLKAINTSTLDIEVQYWINTFDSRYSGSEMKTQAQTNAIKALLNANIGMPSTIVEVKNIDK